MGNELSKNPVKQWKEDINIKSIKQQAANNLLDIGKDTYMPFPFSIQSGTDPFSIFPVKNLNSEHENVITNIKYSCR